MSLIKLQFKPGIVHDVSTYTNTGGWYDCNLMRFRFGLPQTLGGWAKYSTRPFAGVARSLHNWLSLTGDNYLFVGTSDKTYVEEGEEFADITPLRSTVVLNGPFAINDGSNVLTVTSANHGATVNDYVTFSGAASLGGTVTAAVLNQNHQITSVTNNNAFTIQLSVTANASDTGNGGATVTAKYEINVGLNSQIGGGGWGASTWGRSTWGSGVDVTTNVDLRLWYQDNFGEDLIFNIRNGPIYYWDASGGVVSRAVTLESLSSDATCPSIAAQVLVSDRDRHVLAFGCDNGDGVQDPLLIRFSDQENPFVWQTLPTNTAGDLLLGTGSRIIRALETKREIVVFTDATMYSMQFIGPPYTFGIQQISGHTTIVSPNAAIAIDDVVFWMTKHGFAVYDGGLKELDCPVRDYVFNDFNHTQPDKVFAAHIPNHSEVSWFYVSENSQEPDRYVTYNYREQVWYYGQMTRTAWTSSALREYPIAAGTDHYLYNHELGTDADGSVMNSYVESSPVELTTENGPGERHMLISRIIPDIDFEGSTSTAPAMSFTLRTSRYPGSNYNYTSAQSTVQTATVPISQFTEYTDVRLRGRQVVLRAEKNALGVSFTMGSPRIEVRPDGRR
jgi:hypothetical protein